MKGILWPGAIVRGAEIPWMVKAGLLAWIALTVIAADVEFVSASCSDLPTPTATLPKFRLEFDRERLVLLPPVLEPPPKLWQDVNSIAERATKKPVIQYL